MNSKRIKERSIQFLSRDSFPGCVETKKKREITIFMPFADPSFLISSICHSIYKIDILLLGLGLELGPHRDYIGDGAFKVIY